MDGGVDVGADRFRRPGAAQGPCNMTGIRYLLFQAWSELLTRDPEFLAVPVVARSGSCLNQIFSNCCGEESYFSRFAQT